MDELLAEINRARAQARTCRGTQMAATTAVSWSATLANAATRHSTDMAQNNFFSHTGSDGSTPQQRVTQAGYNWATVGENIAAGPSAAAATVQLWLNSTTGHCELIMSRDYTQVGGSCRSRSGTTYNNYWTLNMARPR